MPVDNDASRSGLTGSGSCNLIVVADSVWLRIAYGYDWLTGENHGEMSSARIIFRPEADARRPVCFSSQRARLGALPLAYPKCGRDNL